MASAAYLLGPVTGLPVYFLEIENEHVRFHAAQSAVVFGGLTLFVAATVLAFSAIDMRGLALIVLSPVVILASIVWLYLVLGAFGHGDPRIPVAASVAERFA